MSLKLPMIVAALAALASAVAAQVGPGEGTPMTKAASAAVARPDNAGVSYSALLDDLDRRIDGLQSRVNDRPEDWLTRMHLGSLVLERAGLTNQMEDFERVQSILDESFAIAPRGSGPLMLAARFNFSIHRLDVAEGYLDQMDRRALQKREEQLAGQVLRAGIALQRGQYDAAREGLTAAASAMPAAAGVELALYHAQTGNPGEAQAHLEDALASTSAKDPQRRAWIQLQLGLVARDHGLSEVAFEHLRAADAELPGWWLVQEHLAELHHRNGDHQEAIAIYEALVLSGDLPQHMDPLASGYQHRGEHDKANELIARSAARWQEHLGRLPEAAMGHGLQHHLQFGPPARALELAKANYAVRPGGDAQVSLAKAYLQSGMPTRALELVRGALATPYRTAGLHHVAGQVYAELGDTRSALEQFELRASINPTYRGDEHSH